MNGDINNVFMRDRDSSKVARAERGKREESDSCEETRSSAFPPASPLNSLSPPFLLLFKDQDAGEATDPALRSRRRSRTNEVSPQTPAVLIS